METWTETEINRGKALDDEKIFMLTDMHDAWKEIQREGYGIIEYNRKRRMMKSLALSMMGKIYQPSGDSLIEKLKFVPKDTSYHIYQPTGYDIHTYQLLDAKWQEREHIWKSLRRSPTLSWEEKSRKGIDFILKDDMPDNEKKTLLAIDYGVCGNCLDMGRYGQRCEKCTTATKSVVQGEVYMDPNTRQMNTVVNLICDADMKTLKNATTSELNKIVEYRYGWLHT